MSLVNNETRKLVADFCKEALACVVSDPSTVKFERMRLNDGVLFNVSDAAIAAQNRLVQKLVKTLGPVRGHRSEVEPALWSKVASVAIDGSAAASSAGIDQLLSEIDSSSAQPVRLIKPCHNVRLQEKVRAIKIGPVTLRRTASALPALKKSCPKITFREGGVPGETSTGLFEVDLPPQIWDVELTAAKQLRDEEASWLVDVALSLIRLAVRADQLGPMAPGLGKVEAHPVTVKPSDQNRTTIGPGSNYSIGGRTAPSIYELGRAARRSLHSKGVRAKTALIFTPPKKSLAERFSQGLGWMSRARQSEDRPTRLLYFFTAIEALLSDSDKTSPIVQTVARHAAAILSDDNSKRAVISKDIRTLYGLRSSLVHTGKRGVYDQDSNTIQYVAELLFWNVWTRLDLKMTHETFVQSLSKASYGLKLSTALQ